MSRRLIVAAAVGAAVAAPLCANADTITPGQDSHGHVTRVGKGTKELGLESLAVLSFASAAESKAGAGDAASAMKLTLSGGGVFRYFVVDNLALGLHLGGLYKSQKDTAGDKDLGKTSDVGFVGSLGADTLVSLSRGMFLAPGLSVGGFFANSELTTPAAGATPESTTRFQQSGLAVRAGLGLIFYSSSHFNLFARPEALVLVGSSTLKERGGQSVTGDAATSRGFTSIDGGFSVGFSYVF